MERQWNEDRGLQLGAEIAEALWCLNDHLVLVKEELGKLTRWWRVGGIKERGS